MTFHTVTYAVSAVWIVSEFALVLFRRSGSAAARQDYRSLSVLIATITVSTVIGVWLGSAFPGHSLMATSVRWAGLVVIIAGMAVRWTAILSLGRFFTVDIAIQPGHRLVRTGLYRYVRHPSYSGLVISFLGLGLAIGSWLSTLVIVAPITAALVRRMEIEERALARTFGSDYIDYCRTTRRLFPGIY